MERGIVTLMVFLQDTFWTQHFKNQTSDNDITTTVTTTIHNRSYGTYIQIIIILHWSKTKMKSFFFCFFLEERTFLSTQTASPQWGTENTKYSLLIITIYTGWYRFKTVATKRAK